MDISERYTFEDAQKYLKAKKPTKAEEREFMKFINLDTDEETEIRTVVTTYPRETEEPNPWDNESYFEIPAYIRRFQE